MWNTSLEIIHNISGENSSDYILVLNNLAGIRQQIGDYNKGQSAISKGSSKHP